MISGDPTAWRSADSCVTATSFKRIQAFPGTQRLLPAIPDLQELADLVL